MPLGDAEQVGTGLWPHSADGVADDAVLFDEQLPAVCGLGISRTLE